MQLRRKLVPFVAVAAIMALFAVGCVDDEEAQIEEKQEELQDERRD